MCCCRPSKVTIHCSQSLSTQRCTSCQLKSGSTCHQLLNFLACTATRCCARLSTSSSSQCCLSALPAATKRAAHALLTHTLLTHTLLTHTLLTHTLLTHTLLTHTLLTHSCVNTPRLAATARLMYCQRPPSPKQLRQAAQRSACLPTQPGSTPTPHTCASQGTHTPDRCAVQESSRMLPITLQPTHRWCPSLQHHSGCEQGSAYTHRYRADRTDTHTHTHTHTHTPTGRALESPPTELPCPATHSVQQTSPPQLWHNVHSHCLPTSARGWSAATFNSSSRE
jgi:hypothetical protein